MAAALAGGGPGPVPPGLRRSRRTAPARRRPRRPGRRVHGADGAPQGAGHAWSGPGRRCCARIPDAVLLLVGRRSRPRPARAAGRRGRGARARWCSPAACRGSRCRPTPTRGTCSRCRAGPGCSGLEPEAWGIVFLEAQACGLPVVVGDSGGAPEALASAAAGEVWSPAGGPLATSWSAGSSAPPGTGGGRWRLDLGRSRAAVAGVSARGRSRPGAVTGVSRRRLRGRATGLAGSLEQRVGAACRRGSPRR